MKFMLTIAALCFVAATAHAQTPTVQSIEVVEYGIYTADEQNCQRTADGVLQCQRANIRHATTTWSVPAQHGVQFGVRFRILGSPEGARVAVKRIWRYPPGGVTPSATGAKIYQTSDMLQLPVGPTLFQSYIFDDPWELVPGPWTLELWQDGKLLLTRTFTVVR